MYSGDFVPSFQQYSHWKRNRTARSGRPKKRSETDRRRLGQLVRLVKFKTLTHFQNEMIERGSSSVSKQTILDELNSFD